MRILVFILALLPGLALANDKLVRVYAPPALVESGMLKFAFPRFSLKTQVRIEYVETNEAADLALGAEGRVLFNGLGETWHMDLRNASHPGAKKLASWLTSDVGRRTVFSFEQDGVAVFEPPTAKAATVAVVEMDGDAVLGQQVSFAKCGRCHITERGKGWGIGSTPSFFALRTLADWQGRFESFYALKPHPAFTQVTEITEPFPQDRPSPIAPIEITLDDLEAILAYVSALEAADLGAPVKHQ